MFRKTPNAIVGVDLGNHALKAVRLQRQGSGFTLARVSLVLSHRDPQSQTPPTEQELATLIRSTLSLVRVSGADTHFVVNSPVGAIRYVELPRMPLEDLRTALKYNSAAHLRQNFENYTFDASALDEDSVHAFAPASRKKAPAVGKTKALVAGLPNTETLLFYHAARRAGVRPHSLQLAPIALINGLEAANPEIFHGESVALLDMGLLSTSLTVLDRGKPQLTRTVPMGGKHLTEYLAQGSPADFARAERSKTQGEIDLAQALADAGANLIREICSSINFFENNTDQSVSRILVAGASARSESLVAALANQTGKICQPWCPSARLALHLPVEQRELFTAQQSTFATALGAALSHLSSPPAPPEKPSAPSAASAVSPPVAPRPPSRPPARSA
ncbi:MAG: pilus assembly protein PilM [Verrucomicrobiae bacterium]|nr:pilus assembly protein PilM [Verrucomicrobiae bacterium]